MLWKEKKEEMSAAVEDEDNNFNLVPYRVHANHPRDLKTLQNRHVASHRINLTTTRLYTLPPPFPSFLKGHWTMGHSNTCPVWGRVDLYRLDQP